MLKGIENARPGLKFYIRRRHTVKRYKDKIYRYEYRELIQTYRDPLDKSQVVSKFIAFLGKVPVKREKLQRVKRLLMGRYSVDDIALALREVEDP